MPTNSQMGLPKKAIYMMQQGIIDYFKNLL
jgi:hypothetical protein